MKPLHSVLMTPFDTLFFRDHRPFEMGDQKYCQSLFPTPLTFMGALSSAYLELNRKNRHEIMQSAAGACDPYLGVFSNDLMNLDSFRIKSVLLAAQDEILIPIPANYLTRPSVEDMSEYRVRQVLPLEAGLMSPPEKDYEYREGYIPLGKYGKNDFKLASATLSEQFIQEKRTGIAIDPDTRHAAEGALYFTNHYRPGKAKYEKTAFWVHYQTANGQTLPMSNSFRLGGENRLVFQDDISRLDALSKRLSGFLERLKKELAETWAGQEVFRFSVYLLTPAIFNNGWKPEKWPSWEGRSSLVAACVPRAVYVSGFQLMKNRAGSPRPLHRAVPAGSVYFFESTDASLKQELLTYYLFNRSISDIYPQAGFGTTLVHSW